MNKYRTIACTVALGLSLLLASTVPAQTQPEPSAGASPATQQPASAQPQASAPQAQTQPAASQQPTAASTPAPAAQQKAQPKVKSRSKDDVNAIGDRDMGGKGLGNWYSIEKEVAMGKQYSAMIESSVKMVSDPMVSEYINRVGQNLVRNSDAKVPSPSRWLIPTRSMPLPCQEDSSM